MPPVMTWAEFENWQWALLRNVEYGVVGSILFFVVFIGLFKYMNWSLGITFKDHAWDVIKTDAKAVALYFGLRMLGVLIAGGLFLAYFIK